LTLKFKKFEKEHLDMIETQFHFPESSKLAMVKESCLSAYTALLESKVLMIGGVYGLWQNVGEAWFLMSSMAYNKPFAVAKYSSQLLQHVIEENKLTRVQASVHVDDKQAVRYVEWLGFENEGLMKKFGPDGSDYFRFARVM
tara:strand:+ start:94 stop:519 length:426 start_codon:yes stop_codon:yes gene_type:complete